ncbi:MAG: hypothetical protein DDT34_01950 [Firmicutes bacterium]|nr:hypothetical protein [Bacillota bacterium]
MHQDACLAAAGSRQNAKILIILIANHLQLCRRQLAKQLPKLGRRNVATDLSLPRPRKVFGKKTRVIELEIVVYELKRLRIIGNQLARIFTDNVYLLHFVFVISL